MSVTTAEPQDQTAASLVSGILGDLQRLVQQQIQLTRREIELNLWQRAAAALICSVGAAMLLLAGITLCLSLSHLLHWAASPPGTDPASFPLWACYVVASAVFASGGGILLLVGRARFNSTDACSNPFKRK